MQKEVADTCNSGSSVKQGSSENVATECTINNGILAPNTFSEHNAFSTMCATNGGMALEFINIAFAGQLFGVPAACDSSSPDYWAVITTHAQSIGYLPYNDLGWSEHRLVSGENTLADMNKKKSYDNGPFYISGNHFLTGIRNNCAGPIGLSYAIQFKYRCVAPNGL